MVKPRFQELDFSLFYPSPFSPHTKTKIMFDRYSMIVKFIHMADVHLGNRQYGSEERKRDFAQAFLDAIKFSVMERVDFILISGDLFHKKTEMDPITLIQARKVLELPKKHNIPVIAVEGNHDSTYFRENYSWMDYLASSGLIINLKPSFEDGEIVLNEWDGNTGAYIEINNTRIYGMKYYGSLTEKVLDEFANSMDRGDFTIFMAHVGIEGYVKNMYGCIPSSKLHKVDANYIALGHVHKSFIEGDRIFNPGSLEVCDISETTYDRGIFLINYDDGLSYRLVRDFYKPRYFFVKKYRMKSQNYEEFEKFISDEKLKTELRSDKINKPVVDITIEVERALRRVISEDEIRKIITKHLNPLLIRIHWNVRDVFKPVLPDSTSRDVIEREVISQLLENYPYDDISEEVLKLKRIFSSTFDLKQVDGMIEDIIKGGERKEDKSIEIVQKRGKTEKEEDWGEEEWDWRSACDTGSRVRKHKKL